MFTNSVLSAIQRTGLDPYLGALHEPLHGRPSLACDLVEEWRAFAERLVLRLINRRMVRPTDFVYDEPDDATGEKAVLMKPALLKALITSYHRLLEQKQIYPPTGKRSKLIWIMHQQCQRLVQTLREEREYYEPFLMKR